MRDKEFRVILFWLFVAIFAATAILAVLSVPGWIPGVDHATRDKLFEGLIVEVVASVFAFWKQLTGKAFSDPPEVGGAWEYECIRDDETYKHGGTCQIEVKRGTFGWEFYLAGKRTWIAKRAEGEWDRKDLQAQLAWENTWGAFTGNDALRYAYSIKTQSHLVQGYGWASIKNDRGGVPVLMEGNFFQLPPHDPFYGFQRFRRLH